VDRVWIDRHDRRWHVDRVRGAARGEGDRRREDADRRSVAWHAAGLEDAGEPDRSAEGWRCAVGSSKRSRTCRIGGRLPSSTGPAVLQGLRRVFALAALQEECGADERRQRPTTTRGRPHHPSVSLESPLSVRHWRLDAPSVYETRYPRGTSEPFEFTRVARGQAFLADDFYYRGEILNTTARFLAIAARILARSAKTIAITGQSRQCTIAATTRKKPVVPDSSITRKKALARRLQAVSRGTAGSSPSTFAPPKNLAIFERELRAAGFAPPLPTSPTPRRRAAAQRHAMRRWVFDVVRSRDERGKLRPNAGRGWLRRTSTGPRSALYTAPWQNGGKYHASRARIRIDGEQGAEQPSRGVAGHRDSVLKESRPSVGRH